jgi:hypothetical protein
VTRTAMALKLYLLSGGVLVDFNRHCSLSAPVEKM